MNYNKILTAFRLTVKSANAIEKIIIPGEARNCLFSHRLNNHLILQWHYFTSRIVKQRSLFVRHIDGTHQFEATVHSKRYSFIFGLLKEIKEKQQRSRCDAYDFFVFLAPPELRLLLVPPSTLNGKKKEYQITTPHSSRAVGQQTKVSTLF